MSAGQSHSTAQQLSRNANSKLAIALLVSLLLHGGGYGIYKIGSHYHLWQKISEIKWLQKITQAVLPKKPKQNPPQREAPLMFVNVNPDFAVAEAPKNAKHYAAQNTRASNPDPDKETNIPKISGREQPVLRTEDSQLSKAQPLQPAPPKPQVEKVEKETKPEPAQKPGDLAIVKPQEERRPRTVAEAKARIAAQRPPSIASEASKQDGGVRQRNIASSLDAVGSPFGVYDAAVIAAVQDRWDTLLRERGHALDRAGKVVLQFRLNYDGRITDMRVLENSVDELLSLLCQKAILDPAPYARWPSEIRRLVGRDYRDLTFTFFY